jgi:trk system potassium uptake protein TrkA
LKILIAGAGKVGDNLARQLAQEGYDLTLIDSNQQVLLSSVERYDVMTSHGNCASREVLLQSGVEQADLLIAVTDADEVNLLSCMTAHGINKNLHTIARIRNPEYTDQVYAMRDVFALSMAVNPEQQAASEIERLLKYPGFLKREPFAKGRMEIVELRVDAGSKLCNLPLSSLNSVVGCHVLICAVLRDGKASTPAGDFILREQDRIFVTAPTSNLETLMKNLGIITRKVSKVMMVGGGRISYYLAKALLKSGIAVTIIEKDPSRCVELADLLPKAVIIQGDGSTKNLLDSEGITNCDAFVTLTGIDETNMVLSLYATSIGVPHVITKLGRMENASTFTSLNMGSVVCPRELCCSTIVRYVRAMQNQTGAALSVHSIADGQAEALEFLADEETKNCGKPLKDLKFRPGVRIAGINHGPTTEIPNGESCFYPGDSIVVVTSGDTVIYQLNDIFAG